MWPTRKQWQSWSLPSKLTAIGVLLGVISIILFVLAPLFAQWFVGILPGPNVSAIISGFRGIEANEIGCTYYTFTLTSDDSIEFAYVKLQLPNQINNYKVGLPQEGDISGEHRQSINAYVLGKNAEGKCEVKQAAVNIDTNVQAYAAGNIITINALKLPPHTNIMGIVATNDSKSSINPAPKIHTEGAYEYIKCGLTVRKSLRTVYTGTSHFQPKPNPR